ncbi:hypothetical protein [Pedobacter sp. MC2016-24]|uniref:hypothetical protein n=1 Tax=Pedobacter sp. MC2016-24 TaxID=2780090 RepID=UPI00187FCAE9|nr:hypothetical protein [Pedobacter sp. MC2016-24]MBE9602646.1 hypothetical protein [Pedobacter sp. MC2016-24]
MSFSNDQKKILSSNGYKQSSQDENKYINGGHSIKSDGNKTTFQTGGHTITYGISNTLLDKKSK